MSSHDEQVQQRQSNLTEIARLGVEIYPRTFEPAAHASPQLVDEYGERSHDELEADPSRRSRAAGSWRSARSARPNFLGPLRRPREAAGLHPAGLDARSSTSRPSSCSISADWVGVEGRLFRTRTNELTIQASRVHFLSKCLLPLPEKWHGLTDVEIRYRQRYLDLASTPIRGACSRPAAESCPRSASS
jgi:lysyl-tRNA synthetase class 2